MIRAGFRRWFAIALWKRILGALVLGAAAGALLGEAAVDIKWIGDLFIRMIRMLIVPLVFVTLVSGVASMKDPARLGSIGVKAFGLYLATSLAAILIGIAMALVLRPGSNVDLSGASSHDLGAPVPMLDRLLAIVPENVFTSFAAGDVLAIIFFAMLLGAGILVAGEKAAPLTRGFDAGAEVMLKVTNIVMEVAPIGVFALVAWVMGTEGPAAFVNVFLLAMVVYVGGLIHMVVTHGGLVRLFARMPFGQFFAGAREPQLLAYSTSSSAATLPATLRAAELKMGIKPPVAGSIIPLGATINMDGTALYVAAVAVFGAQIFGVELKLFDYAMIALTTTLVSIGTASVPSASLFLMAVVLDVIGITPAQTALIIGFLLPFDRILDMWRTVVNVTGDLAVATVVATWEGEIESVAVSEEAPPVVVD
ncbi:MAG: dicarboxylate/amino acid:cation symporter [Alphaproteobacteria bacterium HGW-Alphaproteobacteria-16]|nr:MAG: dicarboxylate/amino acid:cation symporter [Alphaproteobacteria bacterium HGW-Alphaproteobacteria-16]